MATKRKYPPEVIEWAVRTVLDWRAARNTTIGGVDEVAGKIGVHPDTLRNWVKQYAIDPGAQPGPMARHEARIAELEQENQELRRVNELLRESSSRGA